MNSVCDHGLWPHECEICDAPVTFLKYFGPVDWKYQELEALLQNRHNALIADQAAEALNDFAAALSLLCRHPRAFSSHGYDAACGLFPYQAILRGLG